MHQSPQRSHAEAAKLFRTEQERMAALSKIMRDEWSEKLILPSDEAAEFRFREMA